MSDFIKGSILGPLLLLININDLAKLINPTLFYLQMIQVYWKKKQYRYSGRCCQ